MHLSETAAFLNHKGGVGKTTSVVNVGAGLAILGKRVLIVDLDPQGHLTGFLGIDPTTVNKTTYDVLRGDAHPREAIVRKELSARLSVNGHESQLFMSVMPADMELSAADTTLSRLPDHHFLLRRTLLRVREAYDYILLDCAPSLGLVTTNALVAADKVFIPVQTEHLALESLEGLVSRIEMLVEQLELDLVIGGLIATRYDGRKVLSRAVVDTLRERFGALLMDTVIRENIALAESPRYGKDIFSYRPRSFGMQDYMNLSLEIMGRIASANSLFSVERGVIRQSENASSVAF
jgi:chromosome partitioning protein